MRKISVYLSNDEAEALQQVARTQARTQSELIREGIRRVITDPHGQRLFRSLGKGRGRGQPIDRWAGDDLYGKVMDER
jgi:hypothetical protein